MPAHSKAQQRFIWAHARFGFEYGESDEAVLKKQCPRSAAARASCTTSLSGGRVRRRAVVRRRSARSDHPPGVMGPMGDMGGRMGGVRVAAVHPGGIDGTRSRRATCSCSSTASDAAPAAAEMGGGMGGGGIAPWTSRRPSSCAPRSSSNRTTRAATWRMEGGGAPSAGHRWPARMAAAVQL